MNRPETGIESYDLETALKNDAGLMYGLEYRHYAQAEGFEETPEGMLFTLWRHPNLLGRPSKGAPSSIFTTYKTVYLLDREGQITPVSEESEGITYDIDLLVSEDIESCNEGGIIDDLIDQAEDGVRELVEIYCQSLAEQISEAVGGAEGQVFASEVVAKFRGPFETALFEAIANAREWRDEWDGIKS